MPTGLHGGAAQAAAAGIGFRPELRASGLVAMRARIGSVYRVDCWGPDGRLKWTDWIENLVVNQGLDHILDIVLNGGTQITTWYGLLLDGTPTVAAGDTMSSHAGWTEVTNYSEANRPTLNFGAVSGQSLDNSGNKASFSINQDSTTIGGAGVVSDNTKGSASPPAGTLYGAGAFSGGDKAADNGDTLNVTVTATASSS